MNKPKIPREVAEAVESMRGPFVVSNKTLIKIATGYEDPFLEKSKCAIIREYAKDNFETFVRAVIDGYEIENTPEEYIRERYEAVNCSRSLASWPGNYAYQCGIRFTLDTLNIKIEGVNA